MNKFWSNIRAWVLCELTGYSVQVGTINHLKCIPKWKEVNATSEQEACEKVRSMGLEPSRVVKLICPTFDPSIPVVGLIFLGIFSGAFLDSILKGNIYSISTSDALYIWLGITIVPLAYILWLLITGYHDFKKTLQP
jgi:hypothetical protein